MNLILLFSLVLLFLVVFAQSFLSVLSVSQMGCLFCILVARKWWQSLRLSIDKRQASEKQECLLGSIFLSAFSPTTIMVIPLALHFRFKDNLTLKRHANKTAPDKTGFSFIFNHWSRPQPKLCHDVISGLSSVVWLGTGNFWTWKTKTSLHSKVKAEKTWERLHSTASNILVTHFFLESECNYKSCPWSPLTHRLTHYNDTKRRLVSFLSFIVISQRIVSYLAIINILVSSLRMTLWSVGELIYWVIRDLVQCFYMKVKRKTSKRKKKTRHQQRSHFDDQAIYFTWHDLDDAFLHHRVYADRLSLRLPFMGSHHIIEGVSLQSKQSQV